MRRIIIIAIALFSSISAFAQYSANGFLTYKGGKFYSNGEEIKGEALVNTLGPELYRTSYSSGSKMHSLGKTLTIVGGCTTAVCLGTAIGCECAMINGTSSDRGNIALANVTAVAYISMGLGIACLVPGVVFLSIGNSKLKTVANIHNATKATVSFEPTQNGMGLCMKF